MAERSLTLKETAHRLVVALEPEEGGGFSAYMPSLPGCVSQGETASEALANIREAFEGLRETYLAAGAEIPFTSDSTVEAKPGTLYTTMEV